MILRLVGVSPTGSTLPRLGSSSLDLVGWALGITRLWSSGNNLTSVGVSPTGSTLPHVLAVGFRITRLSFSDDAILCGTFSLRFTRPCSSDDTDLLESRPLTRLSLVLMWVGTTRFQSSGDHPCLEGRVLPGFAPLATTLLPLESHPLVRLSLARVLTAGIRIIRS